MTENPAFLQSIWNLSRSDREVLIAQWLSFVLTALRDRAAPAAVLWGEDVLLCPMKEAILATSGVDGAPDLSGFIDPAKLFWLLVSKDLVFPDKVGKSAAFRVVNIENFCGGDRGI